jgi:lipopolysaccharide export system protein LptA
VRQRALLFVLLGCLAAPLSAEQYRFSGESLKSVMAEGKEKTVLQGSVLVQSEKKKIQADRVEILGKDFQYFICEGNVVVQDLEKDFTLSSELFHYDNDKRIIRINGPSVMEDRENELIIKCGFLENRENEELIILQQGVRILKEDLACRSEFAVYHRDTNLLELSGLPVVYRKDDVFRAARITVDLDTDEIRMTGEVQGSLLSRDPDESPEEGSESEDSENKDDSEEPEKPEEAPISSPDQERSLP